MENLSSSRHDHETPQGDELTFLQPPPIHSELSRSSGSISLQDTWRVHRAETELRKCLGKKTTETLLKSYSCAWQKDILVQGRMYVTPNWFCFYSNILGWETKTSLKFTDVTSISKQRTALVFPNAILIEAGPKKYGFSSLVHRDKVYHVLITVWKNALSPTPLTGSALLAEVNNWKQKELPNSVISTSFTVDGSESDHETHSHHTLPTREEDDDSFDSDSLPEMEQTDVAFLGGRMSSSSVDSSTDSVDTSSGSASSDSHVDDVPLTHRHSNHTQGPFVNNGHIHCLQHDVSGFSHKLQAIRRVPLFTSTALVNILLIIFIIALLASTLTLFCRLSQVEPSLQPYLILQPWCRWCSNPTDQLSTLTPSHLQ